MSKEDMQNAENSNDILMARWRKNQLEIWEMMIKDLNFGKDPHDRINELEKRVAELERQNQKLGPSNPWPGEQHWFQPPPNPWHPHPPGLGGPSLGGCPVCGIGADGQTLGYVCNNDRCPSRISCSTQL